MLCDWLSDCFVFGILKPNLQTTITAEMLRFVKATQSLLRAETSYQADDVTYIWPLEE